VTDNRVVAPLLKRVVDILAGVLKNLIDKRVRISRGQGPR
jgi:hypothetical protein